MEMERVRVRVGHIDEMRREREKKVKERGRGVNREMGKSERGKRTREKKKKNTLSRTSEIACPNFLASAGPKVLI